MYCQFCGAEATHELNYCKRCGGSLNPLVGVGQQETQPQPHAISPSAVWGIGLSTMAMVVMGLIVLFGFISDMARGGFFPPALVWLALFGVLTILGSVALLMRLWRFLLGGGAAAARQPRKTLFQRRQPAHELPPTKVSAIPEGVPLSVTEHTTRTFSPSYKAHDER